MDNFKAIKGVGGMLLDGIKIACAVMVAFSTPIAVHYLFIDRTNTPEPSSSSSEEKVQAVNDSNALVLNSSTSNLLVQKQHVIVEKLPLHLDGSVMELNVHNQDLEFDEEINTLEDEDGSSEVVADSEKDDASFPSSSE